jgi:hypothetical protein
MKRLFLSLFATALLLSGCMADGGYNDYLDAVRKSEEISSGITKTTVSVQSTFSEALIAEIDKSDSAPFLGLENVEVAFLTRFNHDDNAAIYEVFYDDGKLGMDMRLYQPDENQVIMKIPYLSEYYLLDGTMMQETPEMNLNAFMAKVGVEWQRMLMADSIFKGEKTLIKNEDGDVKATKFSIKPTQNQLDDFLSKLRLVLIDNKEDLLKAFNEYNLMGTAPQADKALNAASFEQIVNNVFDSMTITGYEEVAYVDMDGYLIDEWIKIDLSYSNIEQLSNLFNKQTITIHTERWSIEQHQKLDFSPLEGVEILPIKELKEWSVN